MIPGAFLAPAAGSARERGTGPGTAIAMRRDRRLDEFHRQDAVACGSERRGVRVGGPAFAARADHLGRIRIDIRERPEISLGIPRLGARSVTSGLAQVRLA